MSLRRHQHRRLTGVPRRLITLLLCCVFCEAFSHAPRLPGWSSMASSHRSSSILCLSTSDDQGSPSTTTTTETTESDDSARDKNAVYIEGLIQKLKELLDKWILTGSPTKQQQIRNIYWNIREQAKDKEQVQEALRWIQRAGLSVPSDDEEIAELGRTDDKARRQQAATRLQWEEARKADDIADFRSTMDGGASQRPAVSEQRENQSEPDPAASTHVSQLVARAGSGAAFDGETLGIGGLDDVISQVRRRVWIPLAAPPSLLNELGIRPVRGCLLYGRPGCGKTLLARQLGRILSPARPITVVSGPEILDKFVGSSEKNLRYIFDNPPPISEEYRRNEPDGGEALERAALHVIVMDEFDAIARTRGGRDGAGDQSDAGVARDSVVNQLLAKMDGVDPLVVPTLVIGLTNKRSLIDHALLRPGRFEVQVEVPPPATVEQRKSILHVHTKDMNKAGRLLVRDAPEKSAAAHFADQAALSYDELLESLATICEGFSGASLAGVARAAASHALERAVEQFAQHVEDPSLLYDCIVTWEDFESAITDIREGEGAHDWTETDDESESS